MVVDFWAPWCGPCRVVGPILSDMADEHGERVKFVKLNVDESPADPGALQRPLDPDRDPLRGRRGPETRRRRPLAQPLREAPGSAGSGRRPRRRSPSRRGPTGSTPSPSTQAPTTGSPSASASSGASGGQQLVVLAHRPEGRSATSSIRGARGIRSGSSTIRQPERSAIRAASPAIPSERSTSACATRPRRRPSSRRSGGRRWRSTSSSNPVQALAERHGGRPRPRRAGP